MSPRRKSASILIALGLAAAAVAVAFLFAGKAGRRDRRAATHAPPRVERATGSAAASRIRRDDSAPTASPHPAARPATLASCAQFERRWNARLLPLRKRRDRFCTLLAETGHITDGQRELAEAESAFALATAEPDRRTRAAATLRELRLRLDRRLGLLVDNGFVPSKRAEGLRRAIAGLEAGVPWLDARGKATEDSGATREAERAADRLAPPPAPDSLDFQQTNAAIRAYTERALRAELDLLDDALAPDAVDRSRRAALQAQRALVRLRLGRIPAGTARERVASLAASPGFPGASALMALLDWYDSPAAEIASGKDDLAGTHASESDSARR